jgi:alkanesulfonate monooxygenase SsuD/methylene tetrahydromethanopterin reductase-like flavin-dependent oxidoreductase (luciferase family)
MSTFGELQFDIALPQVFIDGRPDPDAMSAFAANAEQLGFGGLWTQDQVIGQASTMEPIAALCFVAACTRQIRLGVSVIVLPHRAPIALAKSLATLDQLSRGRLELGLGMGNPHPHERAFGIEPDIRGQRLARFRSGLAVMKALWEEGTATHAEGPWPLQSAPMQPKPLQRPGPRIWFGGKHPNALRRAAQNAHGWMGAGSSTIDEFVTQSALMRDQVAAFYQHSNPFRIAKRIYLAVDADAARAERRLREWFHHYYGNAEMASRVCVWGSKDAVIDAIGKVAEAGADLILLHPVFDLEQHAELLADALSLSGRAGAVDEVARQSKANERTRSC